MKILEIPFETIIKCSCGCIFEFEVSDCTITTKQQYGVGKMETYSQIYVCCPVCKKKHIIKTIEGENQ